MLNFTELKTEVATLSSKTATAYKTKCGVWLNMAQELLGNIYDYYIELQGEYDFASVADREDYPMPSDMDKPLRVYDITNDKEITPTTREVYFDGNIANIADAETDEPGEYMLYGTSGITGVIGSSGSVIKAKSSSASDTAIVVRIEGWLDSSKTILGFENITVTGTSYVSGSTTFYGVTKASKSGDSVGYITLADSSDTVLGYMTNIDRVMIHKVLKLGLIPDDAYNYRLLYKKKVRKMVNDYDYPFVDADSFLINEALGYALAEQKETLDRAQLQWNKAKEHLNLILQSKAGDLGPAYQEKMSSAIIQAHRQ